MAFPPLGNSDLAVISVSIDFLTKSKQDAPFHPKAYNHSCSPWDSLCDHLRDALWEDIFKLSSSVAFSEFCERAQVGIDIHIPHFKNGLSSSKKIILNCFNESTLKMMKNAFNFILKALFVLEIFKFLS